MKLYYAGPLFTNAEREWNIRLARALEAAGHEVFLPQTQEPGKTAAAIFRTDVEAIDWADALVAVMDGSDPDSGTAWECGYAYGKKPVILLRTDFRAWSMEGASTYNPMLTESATIALELPYAAMDEVVDAVLGALSRI
jgi:nucleoside 2-deoxyribosyltransferase